VDPREPLRDEGRFGDHARCAGNPKLEIRNPNRHGETSSSEFRLRSSFGFRHLTFGLEREIDELVYALYGLTPEEIKIVEGAAK